MTRTTALAAAFSLSLFACGLGDEDFHDGFPDAEVIKVKAPEGSGANLTAEGYAQSTSDLEGDRADLYTVTRDVTKGVNGGVLWCLGLVKAIVHTPPTSRPEENTRVWGPGSDPLDPNVFRLTMTRDPASKVFTYKLEGKKKAAGDDAFGVILSGTHTKGAQKLRGKGSFTLDFNVAQASIETEDDTVGAFTANYDATGPGVTLTVDFKQVMDKEQNRLVDAKYKYEEDAARNGSFEFAFTKNIAESATGATESLVIKSRWNNEGAGRSDVKVSGGDLGANEETASECWSRLFASVYFHHSWGGGGGWGHEENCGVSGASYATLQ